MRQNELKLPSELDERLREWAHYFKDRKRYSRCASIEGRFNPFAPGCWDEGWGDPGPPQAVPPEPKLPRVLKTHACVMGLPSKAQRWAITFGYCYPSIDRHHVLRALKKYTGRRFTWKAYLDELDSGRMRVWACVLNEFTAQPIDID